MTLFAKLLLLFWIAVTICTAGYHQAIGVPAASRIKEQESKNVHSARIVNGYHAHLGAYPYFGGLLILLHSGEVSVCGSTLVTATKLLTAAHCWNDGTIRATQLLVVLGSVTLFSGGTRISTKDVIVHENFDINTAKNDIAVIGIPLVSLEKLNIKPISLPESSNISFEGVVGEIVGYGKTNDSEGSGVSPQLSYAKVKVKTDKYCEVYGDIFTKSMICTEGRLGGPCNGDSGGPLLYKIDGKDILIGVISFGSEHGCTKGHPSVHTKVTSFMNWLNNKIY